MTIYALNIRSPKYIKLTINRSKGRDSNKILRNFTTLSAMERLSRQEVNNEITAKLRSRAMDLKSVSKTFYSVAAEYTLDSIAHETFSRLGHMFSMEKT